MFFSTAMLALLPVSVSMAAVIGLEERNSCADVHLFLARGNGEEYPGRVGAIGDTACNGLPSCDYENIMFVSTQSYCAQAADGASAGIAQIGAYSKKCPNSKLVLAGYSLGAQIVGDILGGGGGNFYGCNEPGNGPLSVGSSQIAAVVMFGDVRHVANEGYNVGPGSGSNGQYPRSFGALSAYGSKIRSYCLATDPICALGDDGYSHTTYMQIYADAAGQYIQQEISGNVVSTPETTSSAPASTSTSEAESSTFSSAQTSTFAPPTDGPSTAAASSTSVESSAAASSTVESAAATTTTPANTSTFVPFVFSTASSGAPTSTFIPPTTTATQPFSVTVSSTSTTAKPKITSTSTTSTTSLSLSTSAPAAITSKAGAGSNAAQLSMTLLTLVVVKVLAF